MSTIILSNVSAKAFLLGPGRALNFYQKFANSSMLLIQFTGLSGAGKSSIAYGVMERLSAMRYSVEVIDGDVYRKHLCKDLGFSRLDRMENIRRLAFVGNLLAKNGVISLLAAINPFEEVRKEVQAYGGHVKTVYICCDLETLIARDTKGLYHKALLPDGDVNKITNLSGVNDPYDEPQDPDLIVRTNLEDLNTSINAVVEWILGELR